MGVVKLDGPMAWFSLVVAAILIAIGPLYLLKHWRGDTASNDFMSASVWYKSDDFRCGHRRATVPVLISGYGMIGLVLSMFVFGPPEAGAINWLAVAVAIAFLVMLVGVGFYWSILLFSVPKFMIAPPFRGEPGVLAERKSKRLRRNRNRN